MNHGRLVLLRDEGSLNVSMTLENQGSTMSWWSVGVEGNWTSGFLEQRKLF